MTAVNFTSVFALEEIYLRYGYLFYNTRLWSLQFDVIVANKKL